jgi:poly(hydroxyalkanoate) granule-associated protein
MTKTVKRNGSRAPRMKESAQAVWLAGLGALAAAGEEGNRIFHQLVKRGEAAEKMGLGRIEVRVKRIAAKAADLRADASAAFGTRVRRPIDRGMAIALHRFGVPTRSEIMALTKRVEALTRAVEKQHRPHTAHHTPKPVASAV